MGDDPVVREGLGRAVRSVWIEWAKEQPNPKPSWLVPWEQLSEADREVDRRIGEKLSHIGMRVERHAQENRIAALESQLAAMQVERDKWILKHKQAWDDMQETEECCDDSRRRAATWKSCAKKWRRIVKEVDAECAAAYEAELLAKRRAAESASEAARLREAIGVMVPTILKIFADENTGADRECAQRVLDRISAALNAAREKGG